MKKETIVKRMYGKADKFFFCERSGGGLYYSDCYRILLDDNGNVTGFFTATMNAEIPVFFDEARERENISVIEFTAEDVKAMRELAKKNRVEWERRPYVIETADGLIGVNPRYLLDALAWDNTLAIAYNPDGFTVKATPYKYGWYKGWVTTENTATLPINLNSFEGVADKSVMEEKGKRE